MFGRKKKKRYIIRVTMFDEREVNLVSAMEGWGTFNRNYLVDQNHPLSIMLMEPRGKIEAMLRCLKYSRMGIDTCMLKN